MSLPMKRLRGQKRVFRRTPTGRVAVHTKKPTRAWAKCRLCGSVLGGVKGTRNACKSERAPTRIFAGELCACCVAHIVKARVRIRGGEAKIDDYPFALREFIVVKKQ